MHTDLDRLTRAKEWLDAASNKWRLQTLQLRGRYNPKTGEYRNLPTKVRRFLNGTPVGIITDTLELLRSQAPYSEPVFNFEAGGELKYRPTSTFIVKDGVQHGSNGKDSTYTIIQDLRVDGDPVDDFDCIDQVTCSSKSESRYVWDAMDVESLPSAEQGVVWQITGIGRSEETDLLHYQVRKVTAITQHALPYVSRSDERTTTTVETWDNVYGTTDAPRLDTGEAIVLPVSEKGVLVETSFQENADCTYKLAVSVTRATEQAGTYAVYRDRYKIQANERTANAAEPLPKEGVEYSGGVMTKYTSERNPDGTYNLSVDTETERTVEKSVQELRVTTRGITKTVTDANMSSADLVLSGKFGSVKVTKTPGGLFTVERTEFERNLVDKLSLSCSDTAFAHVHETAGGVDSVDDGHVPAAKDGLVTSVSFQTDEAGNIMRTERTQQEHTVMSAERTATVSMRGITVSATHRSIDPAEANALLKSLEWSLGSVGRAVTVKTTDGNMCDVIEQEVVNEIDVKLTRSCADTIFLHTDRLASTAESLDEEIHVSAGGGLVTSVEFETDAQTGAVVKTVTEAQEKTVAEAETETVVTPRFTRKTVTTRNSETPGATPSKPGRVVRNRKTDGGLTDVTETTVEVNKGTKTGTACEKTELMHSDTTVSADDGLGGHAESSPGHTESISSEMDENGVVTLRKTVTDFEAADVTSVSANRKLRKETTTAFRNYRTVPEPGVNGGTSARVNENGTYDGQTTDVALTPDQETFQSLNRKLRQETTTIFHNADSPLDAGSNGSASASETDDGVFHGQKTDVTLTPDQGSFQSLNRKLRQETTTIFHNAGSPMDAGSNGSASASETDDGVFHGQKTDVTLTPDQGSFQSLNRKLRQETTTIFHNAGSPMDAGSNGSASASETDDGVFHGQKTDVTLTPDQGTFQSLNRKLRRETTTIFHNAGSPMDAGSNGSASASETDDGVFHGQKTEVELTPDTATFTSESNHLVTKTTTIFHNSGSPMDAGENGGASASETDDGVFHGQSTTETPHAKRFDYGPYTSTETSPFGRGSITITRTVRGCVFANQASIPTLTGTGKGQVSISCSASINKYGLIDGKIEITETAKVWDSGDGGGGSVNKNIIGEQYKTTGTKVIPLGLSLDDEKPIVMVQTIETTHQIGLNCEKVPSNLLEGSTVSMTKNELYNYHAILEVKVTKSVVKHGDNVTG